MAYRRRFLVRPGKRFALESVDPSFRDGERHAGAKKRIEKSRERLAELQTLLWAEKKHSLLVVLQGMDTGGKDGTINHVMTAFNPQGTDVTGFRVPTLYEAAHDFLWRIHPHVPVKGNIAIFNRSHYEDVLAPRVHGSISRAVWEGRYQDIRNFERLLADGGTHIVKFFLHISREEQLERFAARLDDPQRNWKISESDYAERPYWDEYMAAYEDAIRATTAELAPWYVIPSNHKWFRNLAISEILVEAMESLKMSYPRPHVDLREIRRKYHEAVKEGKGETRK
jgi:PPK2 family polyphosphate:nucleotide phosphotransferase